MFGTSHIDRGKRGQTRPPWPAPESPPPSLFFTVVFSHEKSTRAWRRREAARDSRGDRDSSSSLRVSEERGREFAGVGGIWNVVLVGHAARRAQGAVPRTIVSVERDPGAIMEEILATRRMHDEKIGTRIIETRVM